MKYWVNVLRTDIAVSVCTCSMYRVWMVRTSTMVVALYALTSPIWISFQSSSTMRNRGTTQIPTCQAETSAWWNAIFALVSCRSSWKTVSACNCCFSACWATVRHPAPTGVLYTFRNRQQWYHPFCFVVPFWTCYIVGSLAQWSLVFGLWLQTFPDLCPIYDWEVTTVSNYPLMGQPTQPFIYPRLVNE